MNDETLTLYYYNDGLTAGDRRRIEHALCEEATLRLRYAKLCEELDALGNIEPHAPGAHVTQRWHDSIERAARSGQRAAGKSWRVFSFRSFAFGIAVAVALAAGIRIGVIVGIQGALPPAVANRIDSTDTLAPSFARGIKMYLRDSQEFIADLPVDAATERSVLVARIVGQNRLYIRAAERNHSDDLARVLRAFEATLMQLADKDTAPAEARALRDKLAFELNVILTRLARDASNEQIPI
jgi:hypothetical protein